MTESENSDAFKDLPDFITELTGHNYSFRVFPKKSINGKIFQGRYYQLTPDTNDEGFFEWYSRHRQHQQYFSSKWVATLFFVRYWHTWVELGKPK